MAETTARIRWEDDGQNGFTGHAGTWNWRLFDIWQTSSDFGEVTIGEWVLSTQLPGRFGRDQPHGRDPAGLKRTAEDWLTEFVTSLGAAFPADAYEFDDEPLEVKWAAGRRVRYAHADAGYPGEQEHIAASLTLGEVYTIAWADIGQSRTDLNLSRDRKPLGRFNSVFFEPADDETTAATAAREKD